MGTPDALDTAYENFRKELVDAGLLIPLGVPGVFGRSGVFESVMEQFEEFITHAGAERRPEVIRFPPLMARLHYLQTDHIRHFPDLMGSVHTFRGDERAHFALLQKKDQGGNWAGDLAATDLMLVPAACYPLYPTARGTLPRQGRSVDLRSFVFRHEPSVDPARLQIFRMREFVRLGTCEQALAHRDFWLRTGADMLGALGLDVRAVPANDPFFGRGGRLLAATQKEQQLKYELVVPVASAAKPTAVCSCNWHRDHFGHAFGIQTADGRPAHSACVGFGLERIALALFRKHGFTPDRWPASVKQVLGV
jgi:seryl-tRNA synthetase